eukprot:scaffold235169_cov31-Tisochrysis_lutea.AAC.1
MHALLAISLSVSPAFFTQLGGARASGRTLPLSVKQVYTARFRLAGAQSEQPRAARGVPPPPSEAVVAGLWSACVKAYGSEELALRAVTQNPSILNPLYTDPPSVISNSKAALVEVLGSEDDAIDVMLQNPAVLQCGSALSRQQAEEIRSFARVRQLLDSSPPWAPSASLGLIFVALTLDIALRGNPDAQPLLAILKPSLGAVGAGVFGLTVFSFLRVASNGK